MLLLLPPFYFLLALLLNPIYIELYYEGSSVSLRYLPRTFAGAARPLRLPRAKKCHTEYQRKQGSWFLFRSDFWQLLKTHFRALRLERIQLQGTLWENPALSALFFGAFCSSVAIGRARWFFRWTELQLQPFSTSSGEIRIVFSFRISSLIYRSIKGRFGK